MSGASAINRKQSRLWEFIAENVESMNTLYVTGSEKPPVRPSESIESLQLVFARRLERTIIKKEQSKLASSPFFHKSGRRTVIILV